MIRKVYGIALVLGLALSFGVGCDNGEDPKPGGSGGSTGGSGGSGGTGGIGGSAGCPGSQVRCGRLLDCACVASTCNEDTGEWECPAGYPMDRCPTQTECDSIEDTEERGDCSRLREPGGKYRGLGGCCLRDAANDDCGQGYQCFNGYCTTSCDTDADCGGGDFEVQGPSPFADGSTLKCIQTAAGGWCMAGSGTDCKTQADCGASEVCSFVQSDRQDGVGSLKCLAAYATPGAKDAGELCDESEPYDCKHPTTIVGSGGNASLFPGCLNGLCTGGCDPNTAGSCGDDSLCYPQTVTVTGGALNYTSGVCVGSDCGFASWAFNGGAGAEDRVETSACPEGQWCNRGLVSIEGEQLTCQPNRVGEAFTQLAGQECQPYEKLGLQCAEGLCIQFPPDEGTGNTCQSDANCPGEDQVCVDSNGDGTARCTTATDPGRCGTFCASDAECFEGGFCMRYRIGPYNVGSAADYLDVGICARPSDWYDIGRVTPCGGESDCTKVGDTCEHVYSRSTFALCRVAVGSGDNGDINGTLCPSGNDDECTGGRRCVLRWNAARTGGEYHCSDLSDKLAVGSPCTQALECKSQVCTDSELRNPSSGNRTFCSAACLTSADCGPGMACKVITTNDNSTDALEDDAFAGLCIPLGPARKADACLADADCPEGTSCELDSGQCYTPTASLGDRCIGDDRCPQGAICEEEDRVCVIPGCDPANDTCPVGSVCTKGRGPVYNCIAQE